MSQTEYNIPAYLQQRINSDQAFHYRVVPVREEEGDLVFKTDSGEIDNLLAELQIVLDTSVRLEQCSSEQLQDFLTANYRQAQKPQGTTLGYTPDFLEKILFTAKEIGSSDIHFEPYETRCRVRYRLDGKLMEQFNVPLEEYATIINKIKIKADLDISEKRLPQDGRITVKSNANEFDIRVSSLPTLFGEKIVLRILSKDTEAIDILLTIEDPIEYTLEGINQVQLKESIGLDFASTLMTFLRQDPDIIMVGEIRDVKTANMAIRAALTGHLVLSTIHTNSAWATTSVWHKGWFVNFASIVRKKNLFPRICSQKVLKYPRI